jgi:hypothetical protein
MKKPKGEAGPRLKTYLKIQNPFKTFEIIPVMSSAKIARLDE